MNITKYEMKIKQTNKFGVVLPVNHSYKIESAKFDSRRSAEYKSRHFVRFMWFAMHG